MNRNFSKKPKANGFLMFLLDYRRRQASDGNEMDMMQSQIEAGRIWENMGSEDRMKYSQSKSNPETVEKRYTSFGVSFDEVDRKAREERQQNMAMELTIEDLLTTALEDNRLDMTTFFFISTTAFVETLGGDVYPAELAMSKFTLMDGVFDSLHMFINPGELPLGMAADALLHAEKTHKRALPPNTDGETSYEVILGKILKFMDVQNYSDIRLSVPPIYAQAGLKTEEFTRAKATIEKIVLEAGEAHNKFRVFPLESLFLKLHKKCIRRRNEETGSNDKPFSSIVTAKDMLDRDKFMYADIGCDFHSEKDINEKCCLSKVKRFGYSFITYCLPPNHENSVPGYHYPLDANVEVINETKTLADKEWDDEIAESFKNIRINSGISISERSSMSLPSTYSAASFASSSSATNGLKVDSQSSVPSQSGSNHTVASGFSLSDMIRTRRGGKRGTSRGIKRF